MDCLSLYFILIDLIIVSHGVVLLYPFSLDVCMLLLLLLLFFENITYLILNNDYRKK